MSAPIPLLTMAHLFTLARTPSGIEPTIPRLPDPPMLERVALEDPWLTIGGLAAVGLVVCVMLLRQARGRPAAVVAAVVSAAVGGLAASASLVTTQREHLIDLSRSFIDAVATGQADPAVRLLSPDVDALILGRSVETSPERIGRFVSREMNGTWKLREYSLSRLAASIDGPNVARTQMRARAVPEVTAFPNGSWWILHWRKDPGQDWRISRIEAQQIDGVGGAFNPGL
jgi:hypothetical protein